jgi:hypothetical protein
MPRSVKAKRLFTVVMEFEGTTSVSQFQAANADDALRLWLKGLRKPGPYGLTAKQVSRLVRGSESDEGMIPALLDGIRSVWCTWVLAADKGMALLNIIATGSAGYGRQPVI